ncbi:hypothetical protein K502DRAFT_287369 [Neoconidiobolus thromboides FSU 785]|nr:hypothetical protein K502DRAFT_287369 [Neoconidiobolus thromboides FSU 785]
MEFLNSVGSSEDVYRPSLFELIAQDRLNDLFRPALRYILTVYAQRYPRYLINMLSYYDELYVLLMLVIERHYLYDWNASFSESFYGLRRLKKFTDNQMIENYEAKSLETATQMVINNDLSPKQINKSLFFLAFVPYFKCKMDDLYQSLTGGEAARLLGDDLFEEEDEEEEMETSIKQKPILKLGFTVKNKLKKGFIAGYPFAHLFYHAIPLTYYIAYLFETSDYHSPVNQFLGLYIKRMGEEDYRARDTRKQREMQKIMQNYSKLSRPKKILQLSFIILKYGINFLKILLPMSVFVLKFLEWWYSSNSFQKSNDSSIGPLPPPPEPIKVPNKNGLPLPSDNSSCAICLRKRSNPAMLSTGYTFCYPCIFQYIQEHSKCPITFHHVDLEDIRKLFIEETMI